MEAAGEDGDDDLGPSMMKNILRVNMKQQDTLSEQELIDLIWVALVAGYDTTASSLGFLIHELAANPGKQEKLYEELLECGLQPDQVCV